MDEFRITVKFEGSGAQVTFTETEKTKSEDGVTTTGSKSYGKDFKTRSAAAEAIDLSFRRYLKTLGAPPAEQLELKSGARVVKMTKKPKPKSESAEEEKTEK